jgi:hypothetical protein
MPTTRKRAQKPSLKRSKPIRSWSKAFGGAASTAKSAKTVNGTVADGVRLGYRVIDDYLTKGQEAARSLGGAGGETLKAASTEVQRLTQRMFQYASDLAGAWMELVQTMTANGLASEEAARKNGEARGSTRVAAPERASAAQPRSGGRAAAGRPDAAEAAEVADVSDLPCLVSLEIDSPMPTETTVDLRRRALQQPLEVQPLASDGPKSARIGGVSISALPRVGRALVRIRVPPKQPPGLYRGLIIDRDTNLPCGTLAIRVGGSGATSA